MNKKGLTDLLLYQGLGIYSAGIMQKDNPFMNTNIFYAHTLANFCNTKINQFDDILKHYIHIDFCNSNYLGGSLYSCQSTSA